MENTIKHLNLGSRNNLKPDAINVDLFEFTGETEKQYLCSDAFKLDTYFEAGSFSKITANHFMEHLTHEQLTKLMYILWMLLVPGGKLSVTTPDFYALINKYRKKQLEGDFSDADIIHLKVFDVEEETNHKSVWYDAIGCWYLERENFFRVDEITRPSDIEIQFNCTKL